MIRINLYDYHRILQEITVQKGVVAALGLLLAGVLFSGVVFVTDQMRIASATEEAARLEAEVNKLRGKYNAVQALKKKQADLQSMIKSLAGLRQSEIPFTRLLLDVGEKVPSGLWLERIRRMDEKDLRRLKVPILFLDPPAPAKAGTKKKEGPKHLFIEFMGKAFSDREVARFMERIETLDYLDHVILQSSKTKWEKNEPIREFIVFAHVAGSGPRKGK